jgi:hypothetical protein
MNTVHLSWSDCGDAITAGTQRWWIVRARRLQQNGGNLHAGWRDDFFNHVYGALGELGVARLLGIPWPGTNADAFPGSADLLYAGTPLEVRSLVRASSSCLIVRPQNNPAFTYILADPRAWPRIDIHGWIRGDEDARRPEWHRDANGSWGECWAVPPTALQPIETLGAT